MSDSRPWWYSSRTAKSSFVLAAVFAVAAILGGVSLWLHPRVLEAIAVSAWSLLAVASGVSGLVRMRQGEQREAPAAPPNVDL